MSLVDQGGGPPNIKVRLRHSLTGSTLEPIRGLGVTQPEYEEAKQILETKFGGERRKLQAYMDQIEKMRPLRSNGVKSFEKFADLVRIAVVKLRAEGRTRELQDGALHNLLVTRFADSQVESYSRWLREHKQERSVLSLRDWLKEEVRIRVEAVQIAQGIAAEPAEVAGASVKRVKRGGGSGTLFSTDNDQLRETLEPTTKPPCVHCGGDHGVWSCKQFQSLGVDKR